MRSRSYRSLLTTALAGALAWAASAREPNALVSPDPSAKYHTIQDAIDAAPQDIEKGEWVIHVASSTYHERVYVQREKRHVVLEGESPATTKLTFGLNATAIGPDGRKIGTFRTPALQIDADDFRVEAMTVENSAGPGAQALAVRVDGDRVVFARCHFVGWQDTLFLNRGRQLFERCQIDGAIDFIFGGATAYFDHCDIVCVGNGYIAAASTPAEQRFGFVFDHCTIRGANDAVRTWLARPWRRYASTYYLHCELGAVVQPQGWNDWDKAEAHRTVRYRWFENRGAGANSAAWPNWVSSFTPSAAEMVTREAVLGGSDAWRLAP